MRNRLLFLLLTITVLLLAAHGVCQDTSGGERILLYRSEITVNQDASMIVKETIKVVCANQQINHSIYRDFPTRYKDKYGNRYVVDFTVGEVTRDGAPEPYGIESISNGKRVKMGSADVTLTPGTYTYTITYKTDRQLGFFKDQDELYWNVTGNGWGFPIEKAIAVVTLPKRVPNADLKMEAYTGPEGAKDKNYESRIDDSGRAVFRTTAVLAPKEGLTIVVGWPKGIVAEPTAEMKTRWFFRENASIFAALIGFILVFVYYFVVWNNVGRDPRKGVIIPLYEPPDGLSPAAMRYIVRMGYDNKGFASALINMAVKRYVKISEEKGVYTVSKDTGDETVLASEEQGVAMKLLGDSDSIEMKQSNYKEVGGALKAVKESLKSGYGKGYFARNAGYIAPGLIISVLTLGVGTLLMPPDKAGTVGFLGLWLAGWTFGVAFLVLTVARGWHALAHGTGASEFGSCVGAGCMTLFAIPFVGAEIAVLVILGHEASPAFLLMAVLIGGLNFLFYELLRAPTKMGRAVLDKIEGFKLYLSVAEKDELATMTPPEKTPEIFERYLPYALALDVEQEWAEKFASVLQAASESGRPYQPVWYSGRDFTHVAAGAGVAGFASALGGSVAGAIASSSSPPGSSSGSSSGGGGGGSSGGGGGGGGGGGW